MGSKTTAEGLGVVRAQFEDCLYIDTGMKMEISNLVTAHLFDSNASDVIDIVMRLCS